MPQLVCSGKSPSAKKGFRRCGIRGGGGGGGGGGAISLVRTNCGDIMPYVLVKKLLSFNV